MTARIDVSSLAADGFKAVLSLEQYVRGRVDTTMLELIKLRASILNGCAYCIDMHTRDALANGEETKRLTGLAAWREAPFYSPKERAVLALTDAATRLDEHGVGDDVWADAATHYDDQELADLVLAVTTINAWNRIAITTGLQPA